MALKEKKVVREVTICDLCTDDIPDGEITHLLAKAEGYMKRENFELDLCTECAGKVGLRRRGRRPASAEGTVAMESKRRGRPRKTEAQQEIAATA